MDYEGVAMLVALKSEMNDSEGRDQIRAFGVELADFAMGRWQVVQRSALLLLLPSVHNCLTGWEIRDRMPCRDPSCFTSFFRGTSGCIAGAESALLT